MRKSFIKLTMLGILFASTAQATEFRSPWLSERGPLRYKFEEGNADKYSLELYSLVNTRESHKTFMKHGTDTQPLSALFFNKADVPLNEIFPCSRVHPKSVNYSPYMDLKTIKPRINYYEKGVNFGARLEIPVYKNKGRVGLRVNIPFRQIEIEREDISDENEEPWKDYILTEKTQVGSYQSAPLLPINNAYQENAYQEEENITTKIYNLNFLSKLFADDQRNPALIFKDRDIQLFSQHLDYDFNTAGQSFESNIKPLAGIIFNQNCKNQPNKPNFKQGGYTEGYVDGSGGTVVINNDIVDIPNPGDGGYGVRDGGINAFGVNVVPAEQRHVWAFDKGDDVIIAQSSLQAHALTADKTSISAISRENQIVKAPNVYFFTNVSTNGGDVDYSKFMCTVNGTEYPMNMPCYLKNGWLVSGYDSGNIIPGAENISDRVEEAVELYQENPEQWLMHHGDFELDTQKRSAIGDIDLDLFYEHMFNKSWIGEVMLGVRFPTGSDDNYYGNPYRVNTGNGEHWEIKVGGMLAWDAISWMNVKLDVYGSYALESKEHRMAAFKGAKIKNFGPKVDADVDWAYFVARLDFNFFHMKTKDISGLIGYEFYYKTEDNVKFRCCKVTPWYGNHIDGVTSLAAVLDNKLAEANTEAIAHKIRGESRIQINPWFEIVLAGSYTFAGQNIPRETDCHAGFIYRF